MEAWSEPSRQSPSAIGILLFRYFREAYSLLIIGVVAVLRKDVAEGPEPVSMGILLFLTLGLLRSVIGFLNFRFYMTDGDFVVRKGGLQRKHITIPLSRIQSVHIRQNAWHRLTGTGKLVIDSAGTDLEEITIDAMDIRKAESLRGSILSYKGEKDSTEDLKDDEVLMALSTRDLILFSLTRNHLQTLFLAAGFIVSFRERIREIFGDDEDILQYVPENGAELRSDVWPGLFLVSFILLLALSLITTILKYHNLSIRRTGDGFDISHGLIKIDRRVLPFKKIQLLVRHSNMLRRWLGIQVIEWKTSGGLLEVRKRDSRIPVMDMAQANALTAPFMHPDAFENTPSNGMEGGYVGDRVLSIGLPLTIALTLPALAGMGKLGLLGMLILPLHASYAWLYGRNFRYRMTADGIEVRESVFGARYSFTRWEKLQQVTLSRSAIQSRLGYADVLLHTAGGMMRIPGLGLGNAHLLMDQALSRISDDPKAWM